MERAEEACGIENHPEREVVTYHHNHKPLDEAAHILYRTESPSTGCGEPASGLVGDL